MKTSVQYQHELDQLLASGTPTAAQLADLEHQLQLDIRALEVQFKGREVSELNRTARQSGKERAEGQKRLAEEKERKIQPFQSLLEKVLQLKGA
jgi:hypothetical protein